MLTATPAFNGAPADSAARPTGAPLSVALAAPGLRGMRSAARPEGRGDADRGPLQALNPTSGGGSRRRSPLSNEGLAVCVSFRQFSLLLVDTQQFSRDRVLRADEHENSPTPHPATQEQSTHRHASRSARAFEAAAASAASRWR